MSQKVLIIKLGYSETLDAEISLHSSLGDVLRTTVILHLFKNDNVTWLVDEKAYELLEGNEYINRILLFNLPTVLQLQREKFDTVINFEKVPGICAMADSINAWRRFGFRFDEDTGKAQAYDNAEEVYDISNDKYKKRKHNKLWQVALYEVMGEIWNEEEYVLGYKPTGGSTFQLGLNWAVGSKWPNKAWPKKKWQDLEYLIKGKYTYSWQQGLKNLYKYIDWINSCELLVTNDSLGLHIAIALKKKIVVLSGPTVTSEVFLYGRGTIINPPIDYDCIPCLESKCHREKNCMEYIEPEKVYEKIKNILK